MEEDGALSTAGEAVDTWPASHRNSRDIEMLNQNRVRMSYSCEVGYNTFRKFRYTDAYKLGGYMTSWMKLKSVTDRLTENLYL